MSNLTIIYNIIQKASIPEEVFGNDKNKVKSQYRYFAQIVHPDHNKDNIKMANECFALLNNWKAKADERIGFGLYGNITFKTKTEKSSNNFNRDIILGRYKLQQKLFEGNLSQIFSGIDDTGKLVLLKIVNSYKDNDLMLNEWNNLQKIIKTKLKSCSHISRIIDSFEIKRKDGVIKRINVFKFSSNRYFSFEEVSKKYPLGIPATAAAWMLNRLLAGLYVSHRQGIVHGGIVPSNILINADFHNGRIIDWCYSTKVGNKIKGIIPKYKAFYPKEIFNKTSSFGVDISMAAKSIKWLLIGSTDNTNIPKDFLSFLNYCIWEKPNDVISVYDEFQKVLHRVFGEKKFVKFKME